MSRHGPGFRLRPWLVVLIAGLFVAIALPAEPGAGQTPPPPPAPDPVPDANPNPPPTGGSNGGGGTGGSTGGTGGSSGGTGGSGGGDSSGSSSGSQGASSPPASGGNESNSNSGDGQQAEAQPESEPKREKQDVDKPDVQAAAASEARDPPARPAGLAPGGGAHPDVSDSLELFVLALAGALTVVLLLLAATPPRMLAGVSVTLAQRQRKVELGLAAVLLSLIFGLLAAQCGANLR
jgi:hypothetical protein